MLGYVGDLVKFLVVDRDSNAAGFSGDAYERAGPWRSGVLYEARGDIRVQYGIGLFGEDRVQAVWPGLKRLCAGGTLISNGRTEHWP